MTKMYYLPSSKARQNFKTSLKKKQTANSPLGALSPVGHCAPPEHPTSTGKTTGNVCGNVKMKGKTGRRIGITVA